MIPKSYEKLPLVTIGIPTYNDQGYIALAINDLLNQDYQNIEIIISDNCSTDNTENICRQFFEHNKKIKYVRQSKNIGPQMNFKYLWDLSGGQYFMWAASDDRWDSQFVSTLVSALEGDAKSAVAFCPYDEIDECGATLKSNLRFDFGGKSSLKRIAKFNWEASPRRDAFFYALFNKSKIIDLKIRKWWWINRHIPLNCGYPILSHILASGDYKFSDVGRSLWFNRIHINSKPRHSMEFSGRPILSYAAFILRKLNQLYDSTIAINRGGSTSEAFTIFPILLLRFLYDCANQTYLYARLFVLLIYVKLKFLRKNQND
jgi:glycosyltransferase involved in cell wall biosynthesis